VPTARDKSTVSSSALHVNKSRRQAVRARRPLGNASATFRRRNENSRVMELEVGRIKLQILRVSATADSTIRSAFRRLAFEPRPH